MAKSGLDTGSNDNSRASDSDSTSISITILSNNSIASNFFRSESMKKLDELLAEPLVAFAIAVLAFTLGYLVGYVR